MSMKFFDYFKFFLFHLTGLVSAFAFFAGNVYIVWVLVGINVFYLLGDAFGGEDTSTPTYHHPWVLTAQLWMALPILCLIMFAGVWAVSSTDIFGVGAWLHHVTGYDVLAARAQNTFGHYVAGALLGGLMVGVIGTITAHELTHRTWDKVSMFVGRWLLAFSFDTVFSIEHVYGHHRYVATRQDPATAPRGRNVYHHIVASTIKGNISAWNIEKERLQRLNKNVWSL